MDNPASSVLISVVPDSSSYLRGTGFSDSGTSGLAFSRDVVEAANILCAMRTDKTANNCFQQSTMPFDNRLNAPRLEKRSIVIAGNHTVGQPLDYTVRNEPVNNDHSPGYIPANERFSIQSILSSGQATSQNSLIEHKIEHKKKQKKWRYQNDPDFAERQKARQRERYRNDPDFADRQRKYLRERQRALRKDPAYNKRQNELKKERYRNDPDFTERERVRKRQYHQNPAYKKRQSARLRERYHSDAAFAERLRERQRKRYHNNPDYAKRQKSTRPQCVLSNGRVQ